MQWIRIEKNSHRTYTEKYDYKKFQSIYTAAITEDNWMTLTKRLVIGFLTLYAVVLIITVVGTVVSVNAEVRHRLMDQYNEHFRITYDTLNIFFEDIEHDLMTLSKDLRVINRNDSEFTSFLEADAIKFTYNYTDAELEIIKIFNDYRLNHPNVNSVYMGRENGSFVRSHPRTVPTQYDPRERPWYQLAIDQPGKVNLTQAYSSVTNEDVNIGNVMTLSDDRGQVYGVIGMDVTLNDLSEQINRSVLTYSGFFQLVDDRGIIIVSPEDAELNKAYEEDGSYKVVLRYAGLILEKGMDFYRIQEEIDYPKGHLMALMPIETVDGQLWQLVVSRITFVTGILMLVALINYLILNNIILNPVKGMYKVLKRSTKKGIPLKMAVVAIGELALIQHEYNELIDMLERDESELRKIKLLTISSLASLTEMRDYETGLHIVRTQKYVELIANSYCNLFPDQALIDTKIEIMVQCAPLHDIGKVGIPDKILLKPGPLTKEEFEIMKNHTVFGRETIVKGNVGIGDQVFIDTAMNIVYSHHERWDGTGYPEHLKGDEIPIEARIMAVADVYDALTTKRVYKAAVSHNEAVRILKESSNSQFDPQMIEAFLSIENSIKDVSKIYWE